LISQGAPIRIRRFGLLPYQEAWEIQKDLVQRRKEGLIDDQLLLLEHPSVYTFGRRGDLGHVRVTERRRIDLGIDLVHADRGGDVTWHGPGQLVGYPILSLAAERKDIVRYVRDVEEALIRTIADFGVQGIRVPGMTGVWVGREKVAAIGIRISRWVTSHGFALAVCNPREPYRHTVPCGIEGRGVTTLSRLTARELTVGTVADRFVVHFAEVFGRTPHEERARVRER